MPGFDGTGPNRMGPMTGGGRGFCGIRVPGYLNPAHGFRRVPYMYSFNEAYGYNPYIEPMTREQETEFLKAEAEALRRELETIEGRISQLSSDKK
jgi:hypothetical protein